MIELITRNWIWKLLALLIAVLLWIAVGNEPELSAFVSVPVEFKDLPGALEISSNPVTQVQLELSGPSGELRNFSASRNAIVLNMADAQPGERTYGISEADAHLPRNLTMIRAMPSQVRFVFERHAERRVPVVPRFSEPPEKYQVTPPAVTIMGPESRVNRIQMAPTDLIDTAGMNGAGTFHINAFVEDPHVRIEPDPGVTVELSMKGK